MRLPPLVLRPGDRGELERRVRCATAEVRAAERARLVLMAAEGASNVEIGAAIGMHYNQVAVWRRRYAEVGLAGLEPRSGVNPTEPAVPRIPVRREFEYRRHGTAVLFAGLNVHHGDVAAWVTDSTRTENFVEFLADLDAQTPQGMELHCIVDNL